MSILLIAPGETASYRVYVDDIGAATISSAVFAAIPGLTIGSVTADNTTTPKSVIVPITAAATAHGQLFQPIGTYTLSTGGPLVRPLTVRCSAGLG